MNRFIAIITVSLALLLGTSCDKYLDVNQDPNNPVEVTPDLVLPVAQTYTARYVTGYDVTGSARRLNHLGNMLMYNWSEAYGFSWYDEEFQYLVTSTFYAGLFDDAYSNALKQYTALESYGDEYGHYKAIAKIMKSYHFQILVDLYGKIPYFEALQRGGNSSPKYDEGAAVYEDLMLQLDAAIAMIDAANENPLSEAPTTDDVMFGGDMTKWKQFANTVKARILNRWSGVKDAAYINAELAKIAAEGSGYITTDATINPGYVNEEGKQNPYWSLLGAGVDGTVTLTNDATCATDYIIDYLTNSNDPRISYIYEEPATGHAGVPQGITSVESLHAADLVSNLGPGVLRGYDADVVVFALSESYFNQAELALNGFGGDAEALYNAGVQASFDYLGAPDYTLYIGQGVQNINYAASANKLQAIITQKWIALNSIDAIQSWFDYTRTGYPSNLPLSAQATQPTRPIRLYYPSSEISGNAVNVPKQPNAFADKIFWAQ